MNKKLPALLLAIILPVVFFSCKKSSNSGNDGRMFFPLQVGKYVVYNVDSTNWLDSCNLETASYQMRYTVADTITDSEGRPSYLIDVYQKDIKSTAAWKLQSTVYVTPTPTGLEYVQSNVRFIKLTFPVANGGSWPGNSLAQTNDSDYMYLSNWNYTYQNYQKAYNNGYVNFNNTVTVSERNDSTASYRTYANEVYAYNVGLIYREMTYYKVDTALGCKKGYSVVMRAIDHN